jgi:hypothetical protein
MSDRKQVLTILCKQTEIINKKTSKIPLKKAGLYGRMVVTCLDVCIIYFISGIWTHTIDTLQHQSLSLMSRALDHSTTSAPWKIDCATISIISLILKDIEESHLLFENLVIIFFVASLSVSLHNLLDLYIYIYIYNIGTFLAAILSIMTGT